MSNAPTRSHLQLVASLLLAQRWRLLVLFTAVLAPLLVFGRLAEDVYEREGFSLDAPVLLALHARATPALDAIMLTLTRVGSTRGMVPFAVIVLAALLAMHRSRAALYFLLSSGGAAGLNLLLKAIFQRKRPELWTSIAPEPDWGFPSGHAMGSVAVVAALIVLAWPTRWRWPVIVAGTLFAAGVSLSRLYLGVHFPSDIIAGWAASLAWVGGLTLLLRPTAPRPGSPDPDAQLAVDQA